MKDSISIGKEGESLAVDFLKRKGYEILEQNYKTPIGEIDIIARKNTLCFVEVKTRKDSEYGWGEESVDYRKKNRLRKAAMIFLNEEGIDEEDIRFDVISITGNRLRFIKGAF